VEISKAFELFICDGPIRPLNEMFAWNPKQKVQSKNLTTQWIMRSQNKSMKIML
jgi:predicted Fe-S protein YdhL (DUF1289 family)